MIYIGNVNCKMFKIRKKYYVDEILLPLFFKKLYAQLLNSHYIFKLDLEKILYASGMRIKF